MPQAFVLINVESGAEEDIVKELKKIEGVEEAYFSYGVYDIIAKVKADSMEKLKDMVTRKIRALSRVTVNVNVDNDGRVMCLHKENLLCKFFSFLNGFSVSFIRINL